MFDAMPAQKVGEEHDRATAADRMDALPDALLHKVLSFLPAEDAVQTCVLARRWHHLWKSVPGLRIGCPRDHEPVSVTALRRFVDSLFLLRGGLPLDSCEITIGDFPKDDDEDSVNLWFRHAVACKVRVLTLNVQRNNYVDPWLVLDNLPLVSQQLTRLDLHCVQCYDSFLDFSSCPALERLEFEYCDFSGATKIISESLKSLSITGSPLSQDSSGSRLRICAPKLVSLHLDEYWFRTPILDSMPSLVEAFVRVTSDCDDYCEKILAGKQDCDCEYCDSCNIGNGGCVLLKGLSQAKKLVLISQPEMFIFKRDLRWCPTFSKLKTLLLNDYWCVPDHRALACILELSPILEKLTLHLFSEGPDHKMEMKGSFSSAERSTAISEHLKIVEIKCEVIDERIFKVLKFLCTFNISFRC